MEEIFFIGLLAAGGWLLGVIGFFRAGKALSELRALRATLAGYATQPSVSQPASSPVAPAAPYASVPQVIPQADPEPVFAEPELSAATVAAPAAKPKLDLEALLTLRWGVWLGSAALLFAGVFLVRYAVEEDLLGPAARCGVGALLGLALIAGAEWLLRLDGPALAGPFRSDQAPPALAAGGAAILFGAAYGAGPFYELLPPVLSLAAMAAASLVGLAASLRYGPLAAAVGVAGAFATPALVATETPSMPGLFAYLLVVSAAALYVVRRTAWTWLAWATTIAGSVWVGFAAITGAPDPWAAAAFVPAAAALNLFLLPAAALDHPVGRRLSWVPFACLGVAGLVLESLVPGTAPRAALFLLSPLAVAKGIVEPRLDRLPWLAALFGLLTLLVWALPAWNPTGEVISIEGVVQAILPGAWAPEVIQPLLIAAGLLAAFHAAAGLLLERRTPHPLRWAALVAAVPVLTLAVAYAQVARFQADMTWAGAALALAAALTATAFRAAATDSAPQRAGVHAAGAVAALALGCAILLHDYWLTLAVALFLPALAWIEARADLPALRHVALAVAALVLARLVLNWYVLDYVFGTTPLANGLVAAYAAPAAAYALAARLFRRRADDLLVATLEAGAVALMAYFVALEIRRWIGGAQLAGDPSFTEATLHVMTVSVQAAAYLHLAQRSGRRMLQWAWRILGVVALIGATLLVALNPAFIDAPASPATLLAGYLVPALLALYARSRLAQPRLRQVLATYALVAGFVWITLQVRQLFHPDAIGLDAAPIEDAELWSWSGAWLAYGIALMFQGIRTEQRILRLTALGVIALVCAKVFLVDMSDLTGLWRVLSFLGLGLALIGLGTVNRRFVFAPKPGPDPAEETPAPP